MTHEKKIEYMKIATGIVGFGFDPKGLDMLVSLYDLVIKNEGSTNLEDFFKVQAEVDKRDNAKKAKELLDNAKKKK